MERNSNARRSAANGRELSSYIVVRRRLERGALISPPKFVRIGKASGRGGVRLTLVQEQTLRLAAARGEVRRRDVANLCGISPELARRALLGLEQSGILGRTGRARGTRYVLRYQGG